MATTNREKLFTEFPPVTTEQWEAAITADLKGADYERKLVWRSPEGFNVRPYYRAENLEGIQHLGSQAGEFPYVRGTRAHNRWRVHQTLKVHEPTAEDIAALLREISLPAVELTFSGVKTARTAELVLDYAEKAGVEKGDLRLNFVIDPIMKGLSTKGQFCSANGASCFERIAALIDRTADCKHVEAATPV